MTCEIWMNFGLTSSSVTQVCQYFKVFILYFVKIIAYTMNILDSVFIKLVTKFTGKKCGTF